MPTTTLAILSMGITANKSITNLEDSPYFLAIYFGSVISFPALELK